MKVQTRSILPTQERWRQHVKFSFCLKKSSTKAYETLKEAYGETVLFYNTFRRWLRMFKKGRQLTSEEEEQRVGITELTDVNIYTATVTVRKDHRITL